jgi:hypothetical protein
VQTFLPYPSFQESAQCLDYKRLGKQRVEILQLLNALSGESKGWVNHPACKMWRGNERTLILYGIYICEAWINKGYKDTCLDKILAYAKVWPLENGKPYWLGNDDFHRSHRSNLLRKNYQHYSQFGWTEPTDLPYVWPV